VTILQFVGMGSHRPRNVYGSIFWFRLEVKMIADPGLVKLVGILGASATMLLGLWFVFERLRTLGHGFGPNSLKSLGIVLFVPSLLIVAIAIPDFKGETLAALLGTVAGYVLSYSKGDERPS
jgi:hypothetical protein